MEYTLLRPNKIVKPGKDGPFQGAFEVGVIEIYSFFEHGLEIKKPINTFYKSIPNGQYSAVAPNVTPMTKSVAETYLKFQSIIGHCITNSEAINAQLRDFLLAIQELEHSKEELMKMDFMGLRDVFSTFLHGYKAIHREQNFNSKAQRSALTKFMHEFITDRNIYTHGILRIQRPDEIFVIDYIEEKKEVVRSKVTLEILNSFLQMSDLIRSLLLEIGAFYRNVKGK